MTEDEKDAAMFAILKPGLHGRWSDAAIALLLSDEWRGRPRVVAVVEMAFQAHRDLAPKDQRIGRLIFRWRQAKDRKRDGLDRRPLALVKQQLRAEFSDLTDAEFKSGLSGHASGRYYAIADEIAADEIAARRNPAEYPK